MFAFLSTILPVFSSFITPNWTVYKDVQYGITAEEVADLYLLNKGVHPVVIFIHGGGWSAGDKSAYEGRARKYALAGFHVVAINYRLAQYDNTTTQWNAQLQDSQLAVRWLKHNAATYRIDPTRVGVGGDSAGGHLVLFLGSLDDITPGDRATLYPEVSPKGIAVLDMFGPTDLTEPGMKDVVKTLPLFGGKTYEQAPKLYKEASPINYININSAPTFIAHGTSDTVVPYSQSVALDQKLTQLGIDHEFISFNGGHDMQAIPWYTELWIELKGLWFMARVLKPNLW